MDHSSGPALRSLLLGSADPDRLVRWYADALGATPARGGRLDLGGVTVFIGRRDELGPRNPEPGRLVLNLSVEDIAAVEQRLIALRAAWVREVAPTRWGRIGTALDPDGNYVQVMEGTGRLG